MSRATESSVRVALVGCGAAAELHHAPALKELARHGIAQVVALFDPAAERVAALRRTFPSAVPAASLDDLASQGVELAIVASPPRYHAQQTIELLRSGIAVLCEKPMAMTVAEGEAMTQAASASGALLAVGLFRRFLPATQYIADLLTHRVLGEVKSFSCSEGGKFRWPAKSASFFENVHGRGGILLDIGVHLLDLLIWWWGEPTRIEYADDAMGGIEANCRIRLDFGRGFGGNVRLSRDCALPNRYTIDCADGRIEWDVPEANRVQIVYRDSAFRLDGRLLQPAPADFPGLSRQPAATFEQSLVGQLQNVIAALRGEAELVVPGTEALRSLRAIEWCYEHGSLLAMPWLSDVEQARARQLSDRSAR